MSEIHTLPSSYSYLDPLFSGSALNASPPFSGSALNASPLSTDANAHCLELKIRSYSLSLPCKVGLLWQLAPPNVLKSGPTGKGPVEGHTLYGVKLV
ncbi:hypothetical protein OUZ56_009392 [Daphnia magna]|uniref:Uncharacterized protein n=1 Tax=Daphnia magna TaxID=35525 RepID=A0ABR0AFW4_9CRUS|nr:hypothetical protein OUZ56_009392 [Daphnia magna]